MFGLSKKFKMITTLATIGGALALFLVGCGGETETRTETVTEVQTVVVEKQVTRIEKVVETVVVERVIEGKTVSVVETVIVEKPVTRTEKVIETVIVEKPVTRTEKVIETVIVEKPVTERVVETVVVEKIVEGKTVTEIQTVVVERPVTVTEKVVETVLVVATATPDSAMTMMPKDGDRPGGIIRMANRVSQASNFDLQSTGQYVEWRAATHLHAGLVRLDKNLELIPELAESWTYEDDLTIRMDLRPGLTFHNGNALTAEDVKFSLERVAFPNEDDRVVIAYRAQVAAIEGVEVVDDTTVRIRTTEPFAPFIRFLALPPLSIYDKEWTESQEPAALKIQENGAGPFTVDAWRPGVRLDLQAFEGYWEWPKAPMADRIEILPIRDSVTRVAALLGGQIDFAVLPDLSLKREIEQSRCCQLTPGTLVGAFRGLQFFHDKPPVDDVKIRQAINFALDRDAIVLNAADGFATKMGTSLVPKHSPYYADPETYLVRNVERAKQLVAESKYSGDELKIKLGLATGNPQFSISSHTILVDNLAEVGIELELVQRERTVLNQMEADGEFHAGSLSASDVLGDPDVMFRFHGDNFRNHFKDEENTALVQRGRFTIGFDNRYPIYKELQERVDMLAPSLMFAAINNQHAQSRSLKGFNFKPNRQIDLMKYAWVEQ